MRKFFVLALALVALTLSGITVFAQNGYYNPDTSVPPGIAQYVADTLDYQQGDGRVYTDLFGGNCGWINMDVGNWGLGNRFQSNGDFKLGTNGIGGNCVVPAEVIDTQTLLNHFCGYIKNGTKPRVNTSRDNWGNASNYFGTGDHGKRGDLKISGKGVGGHCWLSGEIALTIKDRIPKFQPK